MPLWRQPGRSGSKEQNGAKRSRTNADARLSHLMALQGAASALFRHFSAQGNFHSGDALRYMRPGELVGMDYFAPEFVTMVGVTSVTAVPVRNFLCRPRGVAACWSSASRAFRHTEAFPPGNLACERQFQPPTKAGVGDASARYLPPARLAEAEDSRDANGARRGVSSASCAFRGAEACLSDGLGGKAHSEPQLRWRRR